MVAGRVAAAGTVHEIVDGRTAVQVDTKAWEQAFRALTDAQVPVLLAGRSVRVPDASVHDVERVLAGAGISGNVTAVPSTLEETLITLGRADSGSGVAI